MRCLLHAKSGAAIASGLSVGASFTGGAYVQLLLEPGPYEHRI